MLAVLRQRDFALLWCAGLVSMVGDWVLLTPLPLYVYSLTGSALATGAMLVSLALPRVLVGSLAGVFVDRWDRKRTMVAADLSRAVLILSLLAVRSAESIWVVYAVAFVQSAIAQFFLPAKSALIPHLVDEERRMAANSLEALTGPLTRLIAPSLGGALMALLGITSVVLADSASFLVSGLLIALVAAPSAPSTEPAPARSAGVTARSSALWREWVDGLRLVRGQRLLAGLCLSSGTATVGYGIMAVLLVVFVKEVLRGGPQELGWIVSAQGLGTVLGGLAAGHVGTSLPPTRLVPLGLATAGLASLAMYNLPSLPLALVLSVAAGVPVTVWMVSTQTLYQSYVADHYRGRVIGISETVTSLLGIVGMTLASGLAGAVGVVPMLDAAGGLYVLAGLIALAMLPTVALRRSTRVQQGAAAPS